MTRYLHTNNANSNLRTAISAVDSLVQVTLGQGVLFPNPATGEGFFVTVEDRRIGRIEIMLCTSRTTDTMTVLRGQQGTVPQSFVVGVNVSNRVTAQVLNDFVGQTEGVFDIARIPPIPDSKLTTVDAVRLFGTINTLRLPDIPRAKITSVDAASLDIGRIAAARLPMPIPAANLPEIPSTLLTSVPAANLFGEVGLNNIPILPSAKIESLAAGKLTGTVPNAVLNASYTNLVTIQGTGDSSFNRSLANIGSGANPAYSFNGATNAGMAYSATLGPVLCFAGGAYFSVNNNDVEARAGAAFKGLATGLTNIPASQLTGSVPTAALRGAMNATNGTPGLYAIRGWAKATISGTTATVVGNGNIPTISHDGSGIWRCLFSLPMPDTNYAVVAFTDLGTPHVAAWNTAHVLLDLGTSLTRLSVMIVE